MTLDNAFQKIVYESDAYSRMARKPNKYMVYRYRYATGQIGDMAMARVIKEFGGKILANGKPLDEALREVFARPDYGKKFHSVYKSWFNRGLMKEGAKITVLKVFNYNITVELPA